MSDFLQRMKDKAKADKKKIVLPEAIKAFGTYEAAVKLHREVQAKLSVKVTEA